MVCPRDDGVAVVVAADRSRHVCKTRSVECVQPPPDELPLSYTACYHTCSLAANMLTLAADSIASLQLVLLDSGATAVLFLNRGFQTSFTANRYTYAGDNPFIAKQFYSGCKWAAITCAVIAGPVTGGCVSFRLPHAWTKQHGHDIPTTYIYYSVMFLWVDARVLAGNRTSALG